MRKSQKQKLAGSNSHFARPLTSCCWRCMTEIKDINSLRIIQAVERKLLSAMQIDKRKELSLMKMPYGAKRILSVEEDGRLVDYYLEEIDAIIDEIESSPEGTEARRTALRTLANWLRIDFICKDIFGQGDGAIYARQILNKKDLPHLEGKKLCSRLKENYIGLTVFLKAENVSEDYLYYHQKLKEK